MSRGAMRLPTTSPVAKTSPVVSTAVTAMTMIIAMMAVMENWGSPKKKGWVTATQLAFPTPVRSVLPIAKATPVIMTRPRRTESVPMKPLKRRWMRTMMTMVPMA